MENDTQQDKLLIKDHEYDGIQELDNNLPTWWLWTFLLSITFGFLYWLHYDLSASGPSLDEELNSAMTQIEQQRSQPADGGQAAGASPEDLIASGAVVFKNYCASCHGLKGEGSIGPNLADNYWIHGQGDVAGIETVVVKGVLDKGMPAWQGMLKPADIRGVTQFVLSMKGTQPANAKKPQGKMIGE